MGKNDTNQIHIERLEKERKNSWLHYANLSLKWNELSNGRSADLSKHLFTIAALVLPISLIPITQENFDFATNIYGKIFLVVSWIAFIISLGAGLRHLSDEIKFFDGWSEQESDKSGKFVEPIRTSNESGAYDLVNKMHDEADKLDVLPKTMSQKYLKIQQKALIFGIISIGAVLVVRLFFSQPQNNVQYNNCWHGRSMQTNDNNRFERGFYFIK